MKWSEVDSIVLFYFFVGLLTGMSAASSSVYRASALWSAFLLSVLACVFFLAKKKYVASKEAGMV